MFARRDPDGAQIKRYSIRVFSEFAHAAITEDENGVEVYAPQCFVLRTGQLVTDMSLDLLTPVLFEQLAVQPSS